jgi:hypothetical protein
LHLPYERHDLSRSGARQLADDSAVIEVNPPIFVRGLLHEINKALGIGVYVIALFSLDNPWLREQKQLLQFRQGV